MGIWLDESGTLKPGEPLWVLGFFTWKFDVWYKIVSDQKQHCGLKAEMHFQKVSGGPKDRRYAFGRRLAWALDKYKKSWYARALYVKAWPANMPTATAYDRMVSELATSVFHRIPEPRAILTVDRRNRPKGNMFIPDGLEHRLSFYSRYGLAPVTEVRQADSAYDDLLQVADFLTGALRQLEVPSGNAAKRQLASMIQPLIDTRIKIFEWNP